MDNILPAMKCHIEYVNTDFLNTAQNFPDLWHHSQIPSLPAVLVCNTQSTRYLYADISLL
jgi:hypothetical protein